MGGKMSPSAVLVIHDGITRLVNVKNQDTVSKIIDMVPDIIEKFRKKDDKDPDVEKQWMKLWASNTVIWDFMNRK